jgi:signal transduction histidine kinase/CheY-like chemotaxis protein
MPAEKRAENPAELRAENIMGDILDALAEGVAIFDRSGALTLSNAAFRTLNPRIADLIVPGIAWEVLVREAVQRGAIPESEGRLLQSMETSLLETVQPIPPFELHLTSGAVHETTLRNASDGSFIVTQRDVTERWQHEISDQQADVLLGKVLEACPANVVMSRIGDGQILYRSPAATELLGTSRCYYDHFASREERADFITALLPDGRVDNIQATGLRSDGTPFPCSISARVIEYHGEDVMVSNTVDISKEVALQRTLAEQREQIFQAEKMSALGELLAGVAHELNNPLSVVVGHALMMREEAHDPSVLRRIGKISDAAERCARIVKSFLAMARQLPAELKPIDLHETIDTAIEALQLGASGLSSTVDVTLPADLPRVLGDADQVAQVFMNLISNADQAMESAGVGGGIAIAARFVAGAGMVEITIADDGPGIPKDIRSRIFDPLFTTKEVGKGTGIGLAFCHRVVTSHRGQIRLDPTSRPGATKFVIRLPAAATDQHKTYDQRASAGSDQAPAVRVLVVDDESDVANLIREILERDGYHVDHAASAEAAFERLAHHPYALVLSDLNMPGLGGRGFYEKIVREHPVLADRVGFVTGDTMSPSARGFLDSAQRPYLEKPIAPAELRTLARRLLEDAAESIGR